MERAKSLGLARSIGVSNFGVPNLEEVLKVASIKPAVNQVSLIISPTREKSLQVATRCDTIPTTPLNRHPHWISVTDTAS